jgi:hypothetical protein
VKNLDSVLKEKEELVDTLQKEIEALRFVAVLLKEDAASIEAPAKVNVASSLASAPTPAHVMQSSSSGSSFEREPGGYLGSGLKQFP